MSLVKLPNTVSQDRIRQWTVEHIVDIPVPQAVEDLVGLQGFSGQDPTAFFVEQTDETLDISFSLRNLSLRRKERRNRSRTHVFSTSSHYCRSLRKPLRSQRFHCCRSTTLSLTSLSWRRDRFPSCRSMIRWSMSSLCWSCKLHCCRSWRRQPRSDSDRSLIRWLMSL